MITSREFGTSSTDLRKTFAQLIDFVLKNWKQQHLSKHLQAAY